MTAALTRLMSQLRLHELWMATLICGRAYESDWADDHDPVRTRFEHRPVWPSSGALGERR